MTLVLVVNLLVSVVLFVLCKLFKVKETSLLFFLCILMPGLGLGITVVYLLFRLLMKDNGREEIKQILKERENDLSQINADMNKKVDIIPIKDALALNKVDIKRSLMIHALKDNAYEYVQITKELLGDDDTEIAHYAASSLTDINAKLMVLVQKSEAVYRKYPNDMELAKDYLKSVDNYLESGLIDDRDRKRFQYDYLNTLEKVVAYEEASEDMLKKLINICLELGEINRAKTNCNTYFEKYPNSATPYILKAKIAYKSSDIEALQRAIKVLSESDILVTGEELKILRYWLKE